MEPSLTNVPKASSKFWNISKIMKRKNKCIPSLKQNGNMFVTNQEKAEILAQNFVLNHTISSSLSDQITKRVVDHSISIVDNADHLTDTMTVNSKYLKGLIKRLKNKKAPGIDGVSNRCLKELPLGGLKVLCIVYNSCFKFGYFPLIWKHSKIIPKPGKETSRPDSYRPISLLNTMSKILETIVKEEIVRYIDDNNILPPQQFGFRAEHNTIQPLVRIRNIVKNNFNAGMSTGMILLDIKAAFDSV